MLCAFALLLRVAALCMQARSWLVHGPGVITYPCTCCNFASIRDARDLWPAIPAHGSSFVFFDSFSDSDNISESGNIFVSGNISISDNIFIFGNIFFFSF